jgi:RsiW-degrading membrane proteinase PrsW (M82 family)
MELKIEVHRQTHVLTARKANPFAPEFSAPARPSQPAVVQKSSQSLPLQATVAAPVARVNPFELPDFSTPTPAAHAGSSHPPQPSALEKPRLPALPKQGAAVAVRTQTTLALPPRKKVSPLLELRHLLLIVAMVPLGLSLFQSRDDVEERLRKSLAPLKEKTEAEAKKNKSGKTLASKKVVSSKAKPKPIQEDEESVDQEVAELEQAHRGDIFSLLPDHKIEGAFLPRDTHAHWFYAMLSAAIFLAIIVFLFPVGNARPSRLVLGGIFTGVVGIILLLILQFLAIISTSFTIRGGGKGAILLIILQAIGYSYRAALDPTNGFVASVLGFTFGVGLCEELTKAIPLFWYGKKLGWREACVWGMASGVGFGVSEGITYCADYYNGITGVDIYVIRFVSCVALHAVWAAAVGVAMVRILETDKSSEGSAAWALLGLRILWVPMVLHGLYDTLLKKDMPGAAFICALVSFGWLAYQMERALMSEERAQRKALLASA